MCRYIKHNELKRDSIYKNQCVSSIHIIFGTHLVVVEIIN